MATEIEAARLLVYKAALLKDQGRNFSLTAAQAKLKTGRLAVRCAEEAVQIHGGYGYIEEYPVCRMYRDAKILTIGEGTDEVQQMVIARALGRLTCSSRVLVANRGEIARRVIRTLRAARASASVAIYTDADAGAPHVREADEAVPRRAPTSRSSDDRRGARAGADALHPGYGFLSENAALRARVRATRASCSSGRRRTRSS